MEDERVYDRASNFDAVPTRVYLDVERAVFVSLDAGRGGLRIESEHELEVGREYAFIFDLPDDHFIEGRGNVCWCRKTVGRYEAGIAFIEYDTTSPVGLEQSIGVQTSVAGTDTVEQRHHPRHEHATRIYTGGYESQVIDLSEEGSGLRSHTMIEPGAFVALVIRVDDDSPIRVHGKIKWCREDTVHKLQYIHGLEIWHIAPRFGEAYERALRSAR